jgi:hypothetical protein
MITPHRASVRLGPPNAPVEQSLRPKKYLIGKVGMVFEDPC